MQEVTSNIHEVNKALWIQETIYYNRRTNRPRLHNTDNNDPYSKGASVDRYYLFTNFSNLFYIELFLQWSVPSWTTNLAPPCASGVQHEYSQILPLWLLIIHYENRMRHLGSYIVCYDLRKSLKSKDILKFASDTLPFPIY